MARSGALSVVAAATVMVVCGGVLQATGAQAAPSTVPSAGVQPVSNLGTAAVSMSPSPGSAGGSLQSLWSARSRSAVQPDGSVRAQFWPAAVNYRDAGGVWRPIDDRLTVASDGVARNGANSWSAELPAALTSPVRVTAAGQALSFALRGADGTAAREVTGSTATYRAALPGVDVAYAVGNDRLEETPTLASPSAPSSFAFDVTVPTGVTLAPASDGGLDVVAAGHAVYRLAPPSMRDSSGTTTAASGTVTMTATPASGGSAGGPAGAYVVTLSADRAWLAAPGRVWPVLVDPTVDMSGSNTVDCNVESDNPTTACEVTDTYTIGHGSVPGQDRAFFRFDDVTSVIPRDAKVTDAQFSLQVLGTTTSNTVALEGHALTQAWTSAASWTTYDGTNSWPTTGPAGTTNGAGGNYRTALDADLGSPMGAAGTRVYSGPLLTAQAWVNGTLANNGLLVKVDNESVDDVVTVASQLATDSSTWPELYIDYSIDTGDVPVFTAQLDKRLSLAVDGASGNLNVTSDLLDYRQVGGGSVAAQLRYDSIHAGATDSGVGWRSTLRDRFLYVKASGIQLYQLGEPHYTFSINPITGAYVHPPGLNATLTDLGGGAYRMRMNGTGEVWSFSVGPTSYVAQLDSIADRNGNTTSYSYDDTTALSDGQAVLNSVTDSHSTTITVGNPSGPITGYTDSTGRSVGISTNGNGDVSTLTDALGHNTTFVYSSHKLTQITTPAGRIVLIGYTSGKVTSITQVTNPSTLTGVTTTFSYASWTGSGSAMTATTTVTDALSHASSTTFNTSDLVTTTHDALGHARATTYTANNDVSTAADAMSSPNTSTFSYDSDFRPTGAAAPTGATTATTYSESAGAVTNPVAHWQPATSTDADGNQTTFSYDGPGNLTKTQDTTSGLGAATSYGVYGNLGVSACGGKTGQTGQVCTVTDPNSNTTTLHYDSNGNLDLVTPPSPLGTTGYTYDSLSRVATMTDGKGQTTRYSYDANDRLTQQQFNGATTCTSTDITNGLCITNGYDDDGNQTSSVDQTGTRTFGYDTLGRETSRSLPSTGTTSLSYDDAGNVASATDAAGTITYGYDNANELTSLLEPGGSCTASPKDRCTTFGYDNNGRRTTTTYPTGAIPTVMTTTFDNSGRISNIKATRATTPTATTYSDLSYTYSRSVSGTPTDGGLTRTRVDNTATGTAGKTTTYGYDSLARLTSAVEKDTLGTTTASWSYGYDNAGNRTSATLSPVGTGSTTAFTYNSANEIATRAGSSTGWSYDANGAETAAVGATTRTTGTWNPKLQNTSSTVSGTAQARTYTGTGNGLRLTAGATSYRNTALGVTGQTISSNTDNYIRDPRGTLVALRTAAGASYYYTYDALGSVVAVVKGDGTKSNSYTYDPYGQSRNKTEAVTNPWQYTGGYLDTTTGLYKLGIRYYDPNLGRFTQVDPTGRDAQYVYAKSSPCSFVDPRGTSFLSSIGHFFTGTCAGLAIASAGVFAADVYDVTALFFGLISLQPEIDAVAVGGLILGATLQDIIQDKRDELGC